MSITLSYSLTPRPVTISVPSGVWVFLTHLITKANLAIKTKKSAVKTLYSSHCLKL